MQKKAFTLVELLVVVLILAILMAVALPLYLGAIKNSEHGAARANMQTIANANQSFRLRTGAFAPTVAALTSNANGVVPDLPSAITGPGNPPRTYEIVGAGVQCDEIGDGTGNGTVPANSFGVKSSDASDGCFIPGISNR